MSAPSPAPRDLPVARRSGDPTLGLIRRVLLVCLGAGAVAIASVAVARWDDPLLRVVSPVLFVVVLAFGWVLLRRPRTTIPVARLVLSAFDGLWLGVLAARLGADHGGWDALFPTTFMGLALFVVIGFLVYPTRFAVLHAGVLVVATPAVGIVALAVGPDDGRRGAHGVDLLRYAMYLAVLAAMVWVLSRTKEHATRAFLVAEHASAEAASMREMAYRDALTGAANRRRLEEELAYQARVVGSGLDVALVYLDLDRFKLINDTLGHAVGDRVLVAVAHTLEQQVRSGDLVARLGGEEFVVVAPGMGLGDAREMAERLRGLLPGAVQRAADVHVTASLGVTSLRPGEDPSTAIERVDALMYRAKRSGRDRVAADDTAGSTTDVQPAPRSRGQDVGSSDRRRPATDHR
ncbi:diguanylate cyclase [Cellulomonas sp. C5510]|uniref:GGDEF domain-containing protein n=1 Tax=Cellulomonas sp. C5510 TaxID=2871170 RepID=UPI001C95150F|nr:GGDEF domain-containing protein [Cellulomonas sp. C5510]QZN84546.1 GGDEF domain-containing protein [Cellulomonas sp. C5510]